MSDEEQPMGRRPLFPNGVWDDELRWDDEAYWNDEAPAAPPEALAEVIDTISAELFKYLKTHPEALYDLKPRQFEELVAEILAHYGWDVHLTQATRDGGYDIFAINKSDPSGLKHPWIIECKKYRRDRRVGIGVVRELAAVRLEKRVGCALLATTSFFSKVAKKYSESRYDLELRDYEGLLAWIDEYKPNPDGRLYIRDKKLVLPEEHE